MDYISLSLVHLTFDKVIIKRKVCRMNGSQQNRTQPPLSRTFHVLNSTVGWL